jgi:hypothetical protein
MNNQNRDKDTSKHESGSEYDKTTAGQGSMGQGTSSMGQGTSSMGKGSTTGQGSSSMGQGSTTGQGTMGGQSWQDPNRDTSRDDTESTDTAIRGAQDQTRRS